MWTLGSMQWQDLYLVDTLASVGQEHLPEFSGQALANTAWAFAQLELKDIPLLDAIAANALEMLKIFKSQELATSAWTFGNCTGVQSVLDVLLEYMLTSVQHASAVFRIEHSKKPPKMNQAGWPCRIWA